MLLGGYAWDVPRDYDEGWRNFTSAERATLEPWNMLSDLMLAFFDSAFHQEPAQRATVADIHSFAAEHWVRECSVLRGQCGNSAPPLFQHTICSRTLVVDITLSTFRASGGAFETIHCSVHANVRSTLTPWRFFLPP